MCVCCVVCIHYFVKRAVLVVSLQLSCFSQKHLDFCLSGDNKQPAPDKYFLFLFYLSPFLLLYCSMHYNTTIAKNGDLFANIYSELLLSKVNRGKTGWKEEKIIWPSITFYLSRAQWLRVIEK